jgi:hypothetical protein
MFRIGLVVLILNVVSSTIFNIKDYGAIGDGINPFSSKLFFAGFNSRKLLV